MPKQINPTHDPYGGELLQDERVYTRLGALIIVIGLIGSLMWAALAPLDKGVAASGTVIVAGNQKIIQAPASGMIKHIAVGEGERVNAGDVLVQLRQTQAQAQVNSLRDQYYTTLAATGRLLAERDNLAKVTFPPELGEHQHQPRVAEIISLQEQLFLSRKQSLDSEIKGYQQSMDGVHLQLKGLQASLANKNIQRTMLNEQISNMKPLAAEGYFPHNRYLDLQRELAGVNSSVDEMRGHIGQLQKQQQETQQRIVQRNAEYQREVKTQLAQKQMEAVDYQNKLKMADFDLTNTVISAPVDGTVVGLKVFTLGGVVSAGEPLMNIVPSQAKLVIEARLKVELIDKVKQGLPVDLIFTAFNQNKTPKIPGLVSLVSADRLVDKSSAEPYYQMQITIAPEGVPLLRGENIKPGMSVEVFVKTGERSLLSYLFKPILDRAHTSLTEE